jgi:hypothetical protein
MSKTQWQAALVSMEAVNSGGFIGTFSYSSSTIQVGIGALVQSWASPKKTPGTVISAQFGQNLGQTSGVSLPS